MSGVVLWPLLAAGALAGGEGVQARPPGQELPAETVAAWTKAGGVYGGFKADGAEWSFAARAPVAPGEVPAFRFVQAPARRFADLPAVEVPFGLQLQRPAVTDAALRELAGLPQLQSLTLNYTGVTDAGLKELAALKQLRMLELGGTKVRDAGLKELEGL